MVDSSEALFNQLVNLNTDQQSLPLDQWNPPFCGVIDMKIAADGTWFYCGTPISRERMVALFSRVLKKEDQCYYLVTPVEKVQIEVEDAPFVVVDIDTVVRNELPWLLAKTNVGDKVVIDDHHRLWVELDDEGVPSPYIHVRSGLNARLNRSVYYRLVEQATHHVKDREHDFVVSSGSSSFSLGCYDDSFFE